MKPEIEIIMGCLKLTYYESPFLEKTAREKPEPGKKLVQMFMSIDPLSTRIVNALKAVDDNPRNIEAAAALNKKLKGVRLTAKKTDEEKQSLAAAGKTVKEVSAAQTSYDNKIEHLSQLLMLLKSTTGYQPNEPELQIPALEALIKKLKADNAQVAKTAAPLGSARMARNKIMYNKTTGISAAAGLLKAYIKSAFGASSPEYKQISGLRFSTPTSK